MPTMYEAESVSDISHICPGIIYGENSILPLRNIRRNTLFIILFQSQASNSLKGKLPPDVSITPMGSPTSLSAFSLPSTCSPNALKSKTPSLNAPVSIPRHIQFSVVPAKQHSNTCFNCDLPIQPYDRVHCKMCEMPCHLGCLSILKPPPLSGDTLVALT